MTITLFEGKDGVRNNATPCFVCDKCHKKFQTKGIALHHNCKPWSK